MSLASDFTWIASRREDAPIENKTAVINATTLVNLSSVMPRWSSARSIILDGFTDDDALGGQLH